MKWGVDRDLFTLWIEHGLVTGSKTWSETHVSGGSSGGGGFVSGGSGYVSAPTVSVTSSVRTRNTFFLKAVDGKEYSADIDGTIPLRDGQKVSVVYVKRTASKTGYVLIVHNHTTSEVTERPQGFDFVAGRLGCVLSMIAIVICGAIGDVVGSMAGAVVSVQALGALGFVGGSVSATYLLWQRSSAFKATRAKLIAEARALAERAGAGGMMAKEGT